MMRSTVLVFWVVLSFTPAVWAQLPLARLDRLFPLGGAAGSSVEITLQGKDLDDTTSLHFDRPGFRAERLKPNLFRLTIPPDASPGTVEVRTVGKYGISGSRLFAVQKGLTEVAEKEPNDTFATAQKVPLDSAINGTSDSDGDDYFRFHARKGQRIVLDCLALRLDSTLRATLVLTDAEGRELGRSRPYHLRTDPLLDLVAPEDGDYVLHLHDMTFAGGLPYRLILSTRPHLEGVFPLALAPGEPGNLTVLGRNLPGGKPFAGEKVLDRELDMLAVPLAAQKHDPLRLPRFDFLVHPSAPAAKLRGWQVFPPPLSSALTPVTLVHADAPVTLEREDNDSPDSAQPLKVPTIVSGRFDRRSDADWYRFDLKAGEAIQVDLLGERLDLPGDAFVLITDDKGNEIAQFDDHGIRFNALDLYNRDPFGTFTAPRAGTYRLLVQERYGHGSPRHGYVLRLVKPRPDFFPVLFHETNPDPTCPLVRQGGSAHVEICLNRRGFSGSVTIEARGLPSGVTCPPVHVSPQTEFAAVVFTAARDAGEWAGAYQLEASATINGETIRRPVVPVQRRWAIANISSCRLCREACLAVRPGAPYGLRLPDRATVQAGKTVEITVQVQRHGDFKGKVQLNGLILPPGFSFATTEIPTDKTEVTAKLNVSGNVPAGEYSVVLRGDAQVPFNRDPRATTRPNVRVADPSMPMTLLVTQAAKK